MATTTSWRLMRPDQQALWGWVGLPLLAALLVAPKVATLMGAVGLLIGFLGYNAACKLARRQNQQAQRVAVGLLNISMICGLIGLITAPQPILFTLTFWGAGVGAAGLLKLFAGRYPRSALLELAGIAAMTAIGMTLAAAGGAESSRAICAGLAVFAWLCTSAYWIQFNLCRLHARRARAAGGAGTPPAEHRGLSGRGFPSRSCGYRPVATALPFPHVGPPSSPLLSGCAPAWTGRAPVVTRSRSCAFSPIGRALCGTVREHPHPLGYLAQLGARTISGSRSAWTRDLARQHGSRDGLRSRVRAKLRQAVLNVGSNCGMAYFQLLRDDPTSQSLGDQLKHLLLAGSKQFVAIARPWRSLKGHDELAMQGRAPQLSEALPHYGWLGRRFPRPGNDLLSATLLAETFVLPRRYKRRAGPPATWA